MYDVNDIMYDVNTLEKPKQKKKSVSFSSDKAQTFYSLISPE